VQTPALGVRTRLCSGRCRAPTPDPRFRPRVGSSDHEILIAYLQPCAAASHTALVAAAGRPGQCCCSARYVLRDCPAPSGVCMCLCVRRSSASLLPVCEQCDSAAMDQDIGHGTATAERGMMSTPPDSAGILQRERVCLSCSLLRSPHLCAGAEHWQGAGIFTMIDLRVCRSQSRDGCWFSRWPGVLLCCVCAILVGVCVLPLKFAGVAFVCRRW